MNKEYCDFCGDETLHWKQGGNEVNIGEIGDDRAYHIPYKSICNSCLPIWNELASKLVEEVKTRRMMEKSAIGILPVSIGSIQHGLKAPEFKKSIWLRFWEWMQT